MKLRSTYLLLCLSIAGCQFGPRIDSLEQARQPEGIATTIKFHNGIDVPGRLKGELLEVREHGLLVIARETGKGGSVEKRLVFVPYTAMEDADFDQLNLRVVGQHDVSTGEYWPPSLRDREKLRLLSRFPQGLSTPLLEQLLEAKDQTAVEVISGN